MRARAALVLLALAAGCFNPSLDDPLFLCGGSEPRCPPGYDCLAGACRQTGGTDASPSPADARTADAHLGPDAQCKQDGEVVGCKPGFPNTAFVCTASGVLERDCPAGCDAVARQCNQCVPGTTACAGDALVTCTATGEIGNTTPCVLGCDAGHARCLVLAPSNDPTGCAGADADLPSLHITDDTQMDTTSCASPVIEPSAGAPALCRYRFQTVVIDAGKTLSFTGSRGVLLIATRGMTLAGKIDAGARGEMGGPGASATTTLGRGGSSGKNLPLGGGGGGFLTMGGTGGAVEGVATLPPAGGTIYGRTDSVPLLTGAFGGAGGYPCDVTCVSEHTSGGGGGGALDIVSCGTLDLRATAVITAGGGGGAGGAGGALMTGPGGGDGGGDGGSILLEAPGLNIPAGATIVANGGGGGGGGAPGDLVNQPGMPGGDGTLDASPASGGAGGSQDSGAGGRGGARGNPDPGGKGKAGQGAGGGGGSAGRVRLNARTVPVPSGGAVLSPPPSTGVAGTAP